MATKAEFLLSRFDNVQSEMKSLGEKQELVDKDPGLTTSSKFEDLTQAISALRLEARSTVSSKLKEYNDLVEDIETITAMNIASDQMLTDQISARKKDLDEATLRNVAKEGDLMKARDDLMMKRTNAGIMKSQLESLKDQVSTKQRNHQETKSKMEASLEDLRADVSTEDQNLQLSRKKSLIMKTSGQALEAKLSNSMEIKERKMRSLDAKRKEVNDQEALCNSLKLKLESLLGCVSDLKQETDKFSKHQSDLEMLKEDVKVVQDRNIILLGERDSLAKVEHQKDALEQEKNNLQTRLSLLQDKDLSYSEDLITCQNRLDDAKSKFEAASSKVETLRHNLVDLTQQLKDKETQVELLSQNVSSAQENADSKKSTIQHLEDGNEEKRNQLTDLENKIEMEQLELDQMIQKQKDHQEVIRVEEANLGAQSDEQTKLEFELEQQSTLLKDLEAESIVIAARMNSMRQDCLETEKKLDLISSQVESGQKSSAESDNHIQALKEILSSKQQSLASRKLKEKETLQELDDLKEQLLIKVEKMRSFEDFDVEKLESSLCEEQKIQESLEKEIEEVKSMEGKLINKIELTDEKTKNLTVEVVAQETTYSNLMMDGDQLETGLNELEAKVEEKEREEVSYNKAEDQVASLRIDLDQLRAQINEENSKFRESLEEKVNEASGLCKPLDDERRKTLFMLENVDEKLMNLEVLIKTKQAQLKSKKIDQKMSKEQRMFEKEIDHLHNRIFELQSNIEAQNNLNSNISREVDRLKSMRDDIFSDEEEITPRKIVNSKRKLSDVLDIEVDHSQENPVMPEEASEKFSLPPATPVNSRVLTSTGATARKPGLSRLIGRQKKESQTPVTKVSSQKKSPAKEKEAENTDVFDFDNIMSCSPSQ